MPKYNNIFTYELQVFFAKKKNFSSYRSYCLDKHKSPNSLFMHSFYAIADIGNGFEVLKLYVEEMNNPNGLNILRRAYQLQNIENGSLL